MSKGNAMVERSTHFGRKHKSPSTDKSATQEATHDYPRTRRRLSRKHLYSDDIYLRTSVYQKLVQAKMPTITLSGVNVGGTKSTKTYKVETRPVLYFVVDNRRRLRYSYT